MNRQHGTEEIMESARENSRLKEQIREIQDTLQAFYEAYSELIKKTQENTDHVLMFSKYIQYLQADCANLKYELMDPTVSREEYFYPEFRSDEETLRLILEEKKSLARFGDGEFSIAVSSPRHEFQRMDDRLARRIREVLDTDGCGGRLLIGIADQYGSLERFNRESAQRIRIYMTDEIRRQHRELLRKDRVYSDAYITRPYVLFKDLDTDAPGRRFAALKEIWKDKRVTIVEGSQTRLGVGNDLLAQAREVRRILAPPTSSFDRYDDIYEECLKQAEGADLFLLAIGPSSGVLAYDLTLQSCQALDVGHIDLEYEWFLAGKGVRTPVPNKYNNEIAGGDAVGEVDDPIYRSQIIASFV